MAATTTIEVPHLGGIKAGYALSGGRYDATKPTVVLINSMCTTVSLYKAQFDSAELTSAVNLLAVEPLGHGATSCPTEHFTYWDSAVMALQVMDKLGIDKAFALGTSQGGWMVARMALLAPERVGQLCGFVVVVVVGKQTRLADRHDVLDTRAHAAGHIDGLRVGRLAQQGVLGPEDAPGPVL